MPPQNGSGWNGAVLPPRDDHELAALFRDQPELLETARLLMASRPVPQMHPQFQPYLRARLLDAAAVELRPRGLRRLRLGGGWLAGGGAALGLAMTAAAVVAIVAHRGQDQVPTGFSEVAYRSDVDPGNSIRVSFNEAMDQTAVVAGLSIRPATAYHTRWDGNVLVITPDHHLAANTPYTVTIVRGAARDARGAVATTDIRIPFGTAPTPSTSPVPVAPPVLTAERRGDVDPGSQLVFTPDGDVVATRGLVSVGTATSSTQSGTASSRLVPPLTSTSTSSTATSTAAPQPALVRLGVSGPQRLGPPVPVAVYSPGGRSIAYLRITQSGADVVVAQTDGSAALTLTRSDTAGSPLAWAADGTVVFVSNHQLRSVDLQGRVRVLVPGVTVADGQPVALSPDGHHAWLGPLPTSSTSTTASSTSTSSSASADASASGRVVDLATGASVSLSGSTGAPAFSRDGREAAWTASGGPGAAPVLDVAAVDTGSPSAVPTAARPGDSIDSVALSHDGSRIAYTLRHADGSTALTIIDGGGTTLAVGDHGAVVGPVWGPADDRLAFVRPHDGVAEADIVMLPASAQPPSSTLPAIPADASTTLDAFVAAQRRGDRSAAGALAPGVDLTGAIPAGLTRSYVLDAAAGDTPDTVTAHVRLVRDPSKGHAFPAYTNETIVLGHAASGWVVTSVSPSPLALQDAPSGPQVVHVATARVGSDTMVRITFDSDLTPDSIAGAVTLTTAGGRAVASTSSYQPDERVVVVLIHNAPATALTLTVGRELTDIAGQSLPAIYTTTVRS